MTFCTTGVYKASSVSDVLLSLVKFSYRHEVEDKHKLGIAIPTNS